MAAFGQSGEVEARQTDHYAHNNQDRAENSSLSDGWAPIIVKVEPSAKEVEAEAERQSAERKVLGLQPDVWVAMFTFVLGVSTIFLWRETRRLAKGAEDQSAIFLRSVLAAEKAANIAERALIGVERPILRISHIHTSIVAEKNEIIHQRQARMMLRNIGRQPAVIERFEAEIRPCRDPFIPPIPNWNAFNKYLVSLPIEKGDVIAATEGVEFTVDGTIDTREWPLDNFTRYKAILHMFGLIEYSDAIGITREFGFTLGLRPPPRTGSVDHHNSPRLQL